MRVTKAIAVTSALLAFCGIAVAQNLSVAVDIKPQPLRAALRDLGVQTGLQILFRAEDVSRDGKTAPAVSGNLSPQEALDKLLANTGLKYEFVNEHTVRVSSAQSKTESTSEVPDPPGDPNGSPAGQANQGSAQGSGPALTEIIVTAQKRRENIQDVPVPVTAISAQVLVENNQFRLQDYYTQVPGLNLTTDERGAPVLSIRGLTTSQSTNTTVAQTIDDVPYGASTSAAFSWMATDIDPNELASVEVLRGPQGTLYGASSLGGLLKFVTVEPSTEAFSGRIQAGTESTYNGTGLGYNVGGAINVPLNDTIALRASAFGRRDPGFIDNILTGQDGVNSVDADGGRLSALWKPSQDLSLRLDALVQDTRTNGSSFVDLQPGFSDLQQSEIRDSGAQDRRIWAYDAILKAKVGDSEITSVTGYNISKWAGTFDVSNTYAPLFGIPGAQWFEDNQTEKFSQEIRLSTPITQRLNLLFGLFYTHESTDLDLNIFSVEPATAALLGTDYHGDLGVTYQEFAAFTDLTYQVTDRLDIQVGGRESTNKQTTFGTEVYPPSPSFADPNLSSKANAFTYLLTPRFKVTPDLMVYGRFASGFRPGGANNPSPNPTDNVPSSYKPDTTVNYEIGTKGNAFGQLLSFDASVYYIDWRNIQVGVCTPGCADYYFENANRAKSQGIELSVQVRPISGLTISPWVALNDAELTKPFPPEQLSLIYGAAGDRLPYSSRFSGDLSAEQVLPITGELSGFVGGDVSYTGQRLGEFVATPQREVFPAYAKINLHIGIKVNSWKANLFANNVADKRALLSGGLSSGGNAPFAYTVIQPRTVGVTVSKEF